jgi:hypothetical protein
MPGLLPGRALLHGLRALTDRRLALLPVAVVLLGIAAALGSVAPAPVAAQDPAAPISAVPWLRLEPDCLASEGDTRVRVLGSGFEPGTRVDIMVLSPGPILLSADLRPVAAAATRPRTAQSLPVLATGDVDELGTFATSFVWTSDGTTGDYEVRARTRGGGPQRDEILRLPCEDASLTINTGCQALSGGERPQRLVVRGEDFISGDGRIDVEVWSSDSDGPIIRRPVQASEQGTFRIEIRVAGLDPGRYRVSAVSQLDYGTPTYVFETPCPSLDVRIAPRCGPAGGPPDHMSVRVEATGFLRRQRAFIIWDTSRSYEVFPTRTDPEGNLVADISPYQRRPGEYAVRVRSVDNETGLLRQRSVPFTIPCEPVQAQLSATECRRPALEGEDEWRWQIELSGRRYRPGAVAVIFDADGVVGQQRFELTADEAGQLEGTIDPIAGPSGRYRIVARQGAGQDAAQAGVAATRLVTGQTTFRAPCGERETPPAPEIVDICGPEAPGQEDTYDIAVSGGGFYPGGVVRIAFGTERDSQVFRAESPEGSYERSISPDGRAEGRYPVRVSQRDVAGNVLATSRRAFFTVPCPIDPTITVVPDQGPAGYTALVEGRDFRPGSLVTLTWDRGLQAGTPVEVVVGASGEFDVYLFILPNDWTGERTLRAGLADDPGAFPDVTDVYLVVPGSGVPPGPAGEIVNRR